jgi:hypothetical protein
MLKKRDVGFLMDYSAILIIVIVVVVVLGVVRSGM